MLTVNYTAGSLMLWTYFLLELLASRLFMVSWIRKNPNR